MATIPSIPTAGEMRALLNDDDEAAARNIIERYDRDDDDGGALDSPGSRVAVAGRYFPPDAASPSNRSGRSSSSSSSSSSSRKAFVAAVLLCAVTMLTAAVHRGHNSLANDDDASEATMTKTLLLRAGTTTIMTTTTTTANVEDNPATTTDDDEGIAAKLARAYSAIDDDDDVDDGRRRRRRRRPLSSKSPMELGIPSYARTTSRPGKVFGNLREGASATGVPLPTNEWYLSLVVGLDDSSSSSSADGRHSNFAAEQNRAYTIPYIVDTVGPVIGLRLHHPDVLSYGTVVQSAFVPWHGLTLGTSDEDFTRRYEVDEDTLSSKLGIGLRWDARISDGDEGEEEEEKEKEEKEDGAATLRRSMRTSVIRGMPYGTVTYDPGVLPTIASEIVASEEGPLIDGTRRLSSCGALDPDGERGSEILGVESIGAVADREVEVFFPESDQTWLVFFSRPVVARCYVNAKKKKGGGVSLPPGAVPESANRNAFQLRLDPVLPRSSSDDDDEEPLVVRIALADACTRGTNVESCSKGTTGAVPPADRSAYASALREHAGVYPTRARAKHAFPDDEDGADDDDDDAGGGGGSAYLFFDWAARRFPDRGGPSSGREEEEEEEELIMFALPHHVDILRGMDGLSSNEAMGHCVHSLHGDACLVKGGLWAMEEELGGSPTFTAPRPPNHRAIPALAEALSADILYIPQENYMRGAGDTYFSGKMLAKLGRIIAIARELLDLAETPDEDLLEDYDDGDGDNNEYGLVVRACREAALPSRSDVASAVERLGRGVEVWLNGSAASPFTYDDSWGGLVNCGCAWNGIDGCANAYPNCPSYGDPGSNFGNAYYNDHHFHYGYHVYAAAVVADHDREWGRRNFERVLLYVRDIANPSQWDAHFPAFRQKDWYLGNSWASGIALFGGRPYLNGRNQESSSEAIAAYEGVALFGSVMAETFSEGGGDEEENALATARRVSDVGRFLAATEIRSADRYWHVYSPKRDRVYPDSYTPAVVSMMWDTMCQFQTWFGSAPYLAYGIQLLPLTPISERRDTDQWLRQLYPSFEESCDSDAGCVSEGWAVLLYAVLASLGHRETAMERTLALPEDAFASAGGSGHSLTNSLWYVSTRPVPEVPYDLANPDASIHSKAVAKEDEGKEIDCGCPESCTAEVLGTRADGFALASTSNGFTCKERIQWVMTNKGVNELGACRRVAGTDYVDECGPCDPTRCGAGLDAPIQIDEVGGCPPCDARVCNSEINQCQLSTAPYLCYEGSGRGGCSATPWGRGLCSACCELFQGCDVVTDDPSPKIPPDVPKRTVSMESEKDGEEEEEVVPEPETRDVVDNVAPPPGCPPCDAEVCGSDVDLCPRDSAPYLCREGAARGGCSRTPWATIGGSAAPCSACCDLLAGCE